MVTQLQILENALRRSSRISRVNQKHAQTQRNPSHTQSCMIINETYCLIVTDKNKYTELLVFLRQKLHKGELKSKSLYKIEEELVQHRWSSDKRIGEKMFTSVPSLGLAIFDPTEAIWFD